MNSSSPAKRQKAPITVVIISNGPGELSTWVKPIAENLHSKLFIRPRYENAEITLKLVLVPFLGYESVLQSCLKYNKKNRDKKIILSLIYLNSFFWSIILWHGIV